MTRKYSKVKKTVEHYQIDRGLHRAIVEALQHHGGLTIDEIAEVTKYPTKTVRAHIAENMQLRETKEQRNTVGRKITVYSLRWKPKESPPKHADIQE